MRLPGFRCQPQSQLQTGVPTTPPDSTPATTGLVTCPHGPWTQFGNHWGGDARCGRSRAPPSGHQFPALTRTPGPKARAVLYGLWRFHHKGVTVVNSLAVGPGPLCSPSPWKSQQRWRGAEPSPQSVPGLSEAAPPAPIPGPRHQTPHQRTRALTRPLETRGGGPGHRQTPCSPGSTLGLTLFFVLVLTNHDAERPHRRGCGPAGWRYQRGCGRGDS